MYAAGAAHSLCLARCRCLLSVVKQRRSQYCRRNHNHTVDITKTHERKGKLLNTKINQWLKGHDMCIENSNLTNKMRTASFELTTYKSFERRSRASRFPLCVFSLSLLLRCINAGIYTPFVRLHTMMLAVVVFLCSICQNLAQNQTSGPSEMPTIAPSTSPTTVPTESPTALPTISPTQQSSPTFSPTLQPGWVTYNTFVNGTFCSGSIAKAVGFPTGVCIVEYGINDKPAGSVFHSCDSGNQFIVSLCFTE